MKELWMMVGILLALGVLAGFSSMTPTSAFIVNLPPQWEFATTDFSVDGQLSLSLDEAFFDPDGDPLAFFVEPNVGVSAGVYGNDLIVLVEPGSINTVAITASDGKFQTKQEIIVRGR